VLSRSKDSIDPPNQDVENLRENDSISKSSQPTGRTNEGASVSDTDTATVPDTVIPAKHDIGPPADTETVKLLIAALSSSALTGETHGEQFRLASGIRNLDTSTEDRHGLARVFVTRLPYKALSSDLTEYFGKYGEILDAYTPRDPNNRSQNRGFGLCATVIIQY